MRRCGRIVCTANSTGKEENKLARVCECVYARARVCVCERNVSERFTFRAAKDKTFTLMHCHMDLRNSCCVVVDKILI